MFKELFNASQDERSVSVTGKCATVFIGITQILLLLVLLRRRYILGQPSSEIWDIQTVLLLSIFGYIGARLYLGGALPVLSMKKAILAYLLLAGSVTIGCLLLFGVPEPSDWANTWLPALLGPAILIGLYSFAALLGRRRINRMLKDEV
ncbi:MAG: hypothetical protein ABFR50_01710 [Candidatus Fermentibacteria bacterium]